MRLETLPAAAAVGHILCHNLADARGRKLFAKGRVVRTEDLPRLTELDITYLRVVVLEPGDVHEDSAAMRLARAVAGPGVVASVAHAGRVNLRASWIGPLQLDPSTLLAINTFDGMTVATRPSQQLVRAGEPVATIKIIPFAVPEADLRQVEALGDGQVLQVAPLHLLRIGVLLVVSPAARVRVEQGVYPAIIGRVTDLGGQVVAQLTVPPDETAVAAALADLASTALDLIITAGETSVVDLEDVIPRGIRMLGGRIVQYGAPVEPGNLLLLAYLERPALAPLAVLGAPGCVRSRDLNVVDLLLPRLMAGQSLTRHEIVALGHGGLL
ncbi:MAG: molybdopterin-binding protein [Oscillochloridaceae bacterium umkhey_bin13]